MIQKMFIVVLLLAGLLSGKKAIATVDAINLPIPHYYSELEKYIGKTIVHVELTTSTEIPDNIKTNILSIKGTTLNLEQIRRISEWFHVVFESGRIEFSAQSTHNGVILFVNIAAWEKISEINFLGANKFLVSRIQNVSELKKDDVLSPVKINFAIEKIKEFYQYHGFRHVQVNEKHQAGKIFFTIVEGEPTVIKYIEVAPMQVIQDKKIRKQLEKSLKDELGFVSGDILDREKIDSGILDIKDWLRDHDFLIASEPAVRMEIYDDKNEANLFLDINYGPRIRFGFRNSKRFSYRELLGIVGEVKEVAAGANYIEETRRAIINEYLKYGYVNIKIDTQIKENNNNGIRQVSFIIDEGNRVRIENLDIEGIEAVSSQEAKDIFYSYSSRLVQRDFFQEEGIKSAGKSLAEYLRSIGYLSAKLDFVKYKFNEKRTLVDVTLLFSEGIQTFVKQIQIAGNKNVESNKIVEFINQKEGAPFNIFSFEKGLDVIKEYYKNQGYLAVQIINEDEDDFVKYSQDQSDVYLNIKIDEGPLMRVGEIAVRGNNKTHARVVTRELPFIKGDILTKALLSESEDNLRKLNLFTSVIIRPVESPIAPDIRDVLILVEEGSPGAIEFGPGLRNDLGLRFFGSASYQNIGGWHRGVSLQGTINRRLENFHFFEYNISLGFREPYLLNWPVTLYSNVSTLRHQYNSFDARINRITTEFRRELTKIITGLIEHSYESIKIDAPFGSKYYDDRGTRFIGAAIPGIIFDTRDDTFNPKKGLYSLNQFEFASKYFGSEASVGYRKITTYNSVYIPLLPDLVQALAINFGVQSTAVSGNEIPTLKVFQLGGVGSIRGYQEDSIELTQPKDSANFMVAFINYRNEFRFPVWGDLGMAVFWDAGNLYVGRIEPFKLRSSLGAGLRYHTPFGPISLDIAKKLFDETAAQQYAVEHDQPQRVSTTDFNSWGVHFRIGAF